MDTYDNTSEKTVYTWPNPHFPFNCLLDTPQGRIFVLENITHNYKWLKECRSHIKDTDFFLITFGWYFSMHLANQSRSILDQLKLNLDNFYLLYNSPEEEAHGQAFDLQGDIVNHNAWLDESVLTPSDSIKKYDALYVARLIDFKRHHLVKKIPRLALAAGGEKMADTEYNGWKEKNSIPSLPNCSNNGSKYLTKRELASLMNESHCGLSLSAAEGACYSSSEYLLCGLPVVSTESKGGRDVWYNERNSIICEDDPDAVAEAVEKCKSMKWNALGIRNMHIAQAQHYRYKFLAKLQDILNTFGAPPFYATEVFKKGFGWYCNNREAYTPHINDVKKFFNK